MMQNYALRGQWMYFIVVGLSSLLGAGIVLSQDSPTDLGAVFGVITSLTIFTICVILLAIHVSRYDSQRLALILVLSFMMRVAFAFFNTDFSFRVGGDESLYDYLGKIIKNAWLMGNFSRQHGYNSIYPEINALLYLLFGDHFLVARLFNALVGTLIVWAVFRWALHLTNNKRTAILSSALVAFYPLSVNISRLQRKDALIILLSVLVANRFLEIAEYPRRVKTWLLMFLTVLMLYLLRESAAILMLLCGLVYLSYVYLKKKARIYAIIAGLVALMLLFHPSSPMKVSNVQLLLDKYASLSSERAQDRLATNTAVVRHLIGGGMGIVAMRTQVLLFLRLVVSPLPFYVLRDRSLVSVLASVGGVIWFLFILPFSIIGVSESRRNPHLVMPLLVTLIALVILSLPSVSLTMEPLRYRMPIEPFIITFASIGFIKFKETRCRVSKQRYYGVLFVTALAEVAVSVMYLWHL